MVWYIMIIIIYKYILAHFRTDKIFQFIMTSTKNTGNPNPISQTPCDLVPELDALGVEVMIIGVGASWTRARIDCLVKNAEDIVEVESFDPDLFEQLRNQTDEFLCRDVSFLLTEIKPSFGNAFDTINPYHPIPFIEFYNNAKDMDLNLYKFTVDGTFTGDLTATNSIIQSVYGTIWPLGTYLVLFDSSNHPNIAETAWCNNCICDLIQPTNHLCNESIYIKCDGTECQYNEASNPTVDNWNVIVYDNTERQDRVVMNISHGMGINSWITIDEGFTYELIDRDNCLAQDGLCWKQSCTVYGTPGWLPIDCDFVCVDPNCQIGGDQNATCTSDGNCDCKDGCYNVHDIPQCLCVTPPVNCSIILDTDTSGTGIPSGEAEWNHPDIDWSQQYTVWYEIKWHTWQNDECQEKLQVTPVNQRGWTLYDMDYRDYPDKYCGQDVRAVVDFGDNPYTADVDHEIYKSEWLQCDIKTQEPTLNPTPPPTLGLPPVDRCNVTIQAGTGNIININVEWTPANIDASDTFDRDQFSNGYKLYFTNIDIANDGADNNDFLVASYKVYNETFFAESLSNWNATLLMNGAMEIKISVVIHEVNDPNTDLDDIDPAFNQLMYEQGTICDWYTHQPTPSPTNNPTLPPSNRPSISPTISPTMSPTYSWWELSGCVIIVKNQAGTDWEITWIESDPSDDPNLPNTRKIYVYINGDEQWIFNENQFSSQERTVNSQILNPVITDTEVELIAQHLTKGDDSSSLEFSPNTAICQIQTSEPTNHPTQAPTTDSPTRSPIDVPTKEPSTSPTQSPTYHLPIEWCDILILNDGAYKVTFKIPEYKDPFTPPIDDVQYVVYYADGQDTTKATDVESTTNVTKIEFTNGVDISYDTIFTMTTISMDASQTYADLTECDIETLEPTSHPTQNPSMTPTLSPTHSPIASFVYSDDETVCLGEERCACVMHKDQDYDCVGSWYPDLPQIEDTRIRFAPYDGVQMPVLNVGRYPYEFRYPIEISWEFIYLNDSADFKYDERIKPIKGSTIIEAGEYLGEIVFAEFVPMPNEQRMNDAQWYRFQIKSCRVVMEDERSTMEINNELGCGPIYPSWAYIIWVPPEAMEALIIGGGEPWPDWIFYLLLGASVTAVVTCYVAFVAAKNRNLRNNAAAQNLQSEAMLSGIAPSAHVVNQ